MTVDLSHSLALIFVAAAGVALGLFFGHRRAYAARLQLQQQLETQRQTFESQLREERLGAASQQATLRALGDEHRRQSAVPPRQRVHRPFANHQRAGGPPPDPPSRDRGLGFFRV